MKPKRLLLLENVHPIARELLVEEGFEVETSSSALKPEELKAKLRGVDVLGIRSKTHVPAEVLATADSLLAIGAFCIGTNQVDLVAANQRGVPVFNAPFSNTRSVAEMVIAEIIMLARELGDRSREVHAGTWKKSAASSYEVRGKTLGVVGYGHIGRQLGVLAESLGLRVVFFDIAQRLPMGNNQPRPTLASVLAEADFVTLHVPETPQTKGMIGARELAAMKKGSYLINASRGTVVDIDALAQALRSRHIAGAAIDVFPEEPESNVEGSFVTPLRGLPNVVLTPHVGGSTAEAQQAIGREVATTLTRFLKEGATTGSVNFPQVELPKSDGSQRILHVHQNVPGVLRDVNRIVASSQANIRGQILGTDASIGCLIMDVEHATADTLCEALASLPTTIRARTL